MLNVAIRTSVFTNKLEFSFHTKKMPKRFNEAAEMESLEHSVEKAGILKLERWPVTSTSKILDIQAVYLTVGCESLIYFVIELKTLYIF